MDIPPLNSWDSSLGMSASPCGNHCSIWRGVAQHSGIYKFYSCSLCGEVSRLELITKVQSLPFALARCLKAHVLWQQRDKLVQNLLCSTNPFISFLFLLPVTCEFHPKVNELPRLLQCIAAYSAHCLGLLEGHNTSAVCANFHSLLVARNRKTITCMLKTLFKRCKQYQIVRKNQTVDPAGSNSDILVEAFVFLYPIQINQC